MQPCLRFYLINWVRRHHSRISRLSQLLSHLRPRLLIVFNELSNLAISSRSSFGIVDLIGLPLLLLQFEELSVVGEHDAQEMVEVVEGLGKDSVGRACGVWGFDWDGPCYCHSGILTAAGD